MTTRQFHEDECEKALYEESICTCETNTSMPRYWNGEDPRIRRGLSSHGGRTHGPAMDW